MTMGQQNTIDYCCCSHSGAAAVSAPNSASRLFFSFDPAVIVEVDAFEEME